MQRRDDIVLGPEELTVLHRAFDAVWSEIVSDYDASDTDLAVGRLRLARAVLVAHQCGARTSHVIAAAALRRMAMWRHESRVAL
jgi:hypothetical protein